MNGSVAKMWRDASEHEKLDVLARAFAAKCPLSCELLGEEPEELDRLALPLGFVPVFVPTVEATGLSTQTPGVVSPAIAEDYRPRKPRDQGVLNG